MKTTAAEKSAVKTTAVETTAVKPTAVEKTAVAQDEGADDVLTLLTHVWHIIGVVAQG